VFSIQEDLNRIFHQIECCYRKDDMDTFKKCGAVI